MVANNDTIQLHGCFEMKKEHLLIKHRNLEFLQREEAVLLDQLRLQRLVMLTMMEIWICILDL